MDKDQKSTATVYVCTALAALFAALLLYPMSGLTVILLTAAVLGVAFAAFVIWLIVRLVPPRKPFGTISMIFITLVASSAAFTATCAGTAMVHINPPMKRPNPLMLGVLAAGCVGGVLVYVFRKQKPPP